MTTNRIALLAASTVLLSGCGTVCNLAGGHAQPYGGLAADTQFITSSNQSIVHGSSPASFACELALFGGEICATAVGDTVTLPLVICTAAARRRDDAVMEERYSTLPAQYGSDSGGASPPAPPPADGATPAEDGGWHGRLGE